jgi:hypothetical protein
MASIITGFETDVFISYLHKDNKGHTWVNEFGSRINHMVIGFNPASKGKTIVFIALALVICLSGKSQAQTDSLKTSTGENIIWYFDIGFGPNNRGANFDMSFTVSSIKMLGGSLNFMAGFVRLKDVPADYYNGLFRWATPVNTFWDLSLNLTVKLSNPDKPFRFGLEAGPSFIRYDMIELTENPNYPDLFEYKYNKIHTMHNTAGFYCAMKAEIPALNFLGCSFILFGNINTVQSLFGLDVCVSLGKVRKN